MKKLNDQNFKEETKSGVVVIDLYADWCSPCRVLAPIVEELEGQYKSITFAKLDVDESPVTAQEFGVMSIPTVLILKDGKEVKRIVGLYPKSAYVDAVKALATA